MSLDLKKAHKAMQSFKTAAGGEKLEKLSSTLADLKKSIPVALNDTEFDYVIKALINQRSSFINVKRTKGGFVILGAVPPAPAFK